MFLEFLKSFVIIILAEIGDKTQLLALSFSLSYSLKKLFLGFLLGSILSQGLSVAFGQIIRSFNIGNYLFYISAAVFLYFGFMNAVKHRKRPLRKYEKFKNPIYLIAVSFFIVEFGDKTQLSAFAVSLHSNYPFLNLIGGIIGILSISVVFIIMNKKLGSRVPEESFKIFSSFVLIIVGLINLTKALPGFITENILYLIALFAVVLVYFYFSISTWKSKREKEINPLNSSDKELENYYSELKEYIDEICLGFDNCGDCQGNECIIGYTKKTIDNIIQGNNIDIENKKEFKSSLGKDFNKERIYPSIAIIISFIENHPEYTDEQLAVLHRTRNNLEKIIFGKSLKFKNINYYLDKTKSINRIASSKIESFYRKISD
jgi:putative Ca2+/H+ antiporter (TMEM165/GDT1 family)